MFLTQADAICLTTNGATTNTGLAIMGRGNALHATRCWYGIKELLGQKIKRKGNRVQLLTRRNGELPYLRLPRKNGDHLDVATPWHVVSFPVKDHWKNDANKDLIRQSCSQLKKLASKLGWETVLLPRPGCGNGNLNWKKDVRPILKAAFKGDSRFVIVTNED
jgi:hypothetical protein